MDEEKLISLVQKYEFIYNIKHSKYMDIQKKENAWNTISRELKYPAIACKQKWQSLRDYYRKAINKRKQGQNVKPWKYEMEMKFVTPYLKERKTQDCTESTSDDEEFDNSAENLQYDLPVRVYLSENQNTDNEENIGTDACDSNSTSGFFEDDAPLSKKNALKRKCSERAPSISALIMAKLLDDHKKHQELDDLDYFFLSMAATVKKFPLYTQALLKKKIFNLVSDMELKQLGQEVSHSNHNDPEIEDNMNYSATNDEERKPPRP